MANKLYNETQQNCIYGHYDKDVPAGYVLTNRDELSSPWYYVYQNKKVLLYVDQNGPVKVQYNPPSGILVFKRELGENQSKWQVWVSSKDLNNGVPVSNFGAPVLQHNLKNPVCTVNWAPEKAIYKLEFDNVDIVTELFVPIDKATVCMKTTIINKSDKSMDFDVVPCVFPYVNKPQMVAWDLPEWYLSTTTTKNGNAFSICGDMKDPSMKIENYRSVTFNLDYDENAEVELDMSRLTGSGNFFAPKAVINNLDFPNRMGGSDLEYSERQAVWAAKYKATLKAGESKTFTQVLTIQDARIYSKEENEFERNYFDADAYNGFIAKAKAFYNDLFSKRSIKTNNEIYDNFINNFTPLQMYWVCSLDRGWPSSMRGTRDASQDFCGMNPIDPNWAKQTMLQLFRHQRSTDGWFPRQISTISRQAPHDMRNFSDGGAFLLELFYEYMTFTRDTSFLEEKCYWLDTDEESTVLDHIIKCVDYYIRPQGVGEHGLCKSWFGDWWDILDNVGSEGRGESVTVTAQMILNLKNMVEVFKWLQKNQKLDARYISLIDDYAKARENFIKAMKTYAYNSAGYFNGYFNDDGKWLFSNNDPDGEARLYLVSNVWSIICGVADDEMTKKVLQNIEEKTFANMGYNLHSLAFKKPVPKAGRVGSGTMPYVAPYNHAQSFLVRACCVAGDVDMAYKATRYILPIEQKYAPVEKTFAPPFTIANAYSNSEANLHRVELQYLSGTVSYVLRTVYSYFFGITYGLEGLTIKNSLPNEFGDCSAKFEYLGKKFDLIFTKTENSEKSVKFNGKLWDKTVYAEEYRKFFPYFADEDMQENNIIEIEY